jgi:hypothetical protein
MRSIDALGKRQMKMILGCEIAIKPYIFGLSHDRLGSNPVQAGGHNPRDGPMKKKIP